MKWAYYNDNDAFCCEWLRNLIKAGHIPDGEVDERPIQEVKADELQGFRQIHFFAGVGGWAYALRLAGWPEERPVWTGSCPCQPYSQAGKGKGDDDPRNLWPVWRPLIAECRPAVCFGEQTAGKAAREWLSRVRVDLVELGYAVGAADLLAACLAAPHIRQRLWWVADSSSGGQRRRAGASGEDRQETRDCGGLGDADPRGCAQAETVSRGTTTGIGLPMSSSGLADSSSQRCDGQQVHLPGRGPQQESIEAAGGRSALAPCADGKARRIEPRTFPLAFGLPRSVGRIKPLLEAVGLLAKATETLTGAKSNRVGRLRGYGNAIVSRVAAEFIRAWMEVKADE